MKPDFKNIIWDFDGVIVDSAAVKDKAFRAIVAGHPQELIEQFMQYHHENGGISRFVKIRYFYEQLLGSSIDEAKVQELSNKFSDIVKAALTQKKYLIADAVDYIKAYNKQHRMHVVSGSEQTELRFLIESLGLTSCFISILGSPTTKIDNVRNLLAEHQYATADTCLIGDSGNDYEAATINNITFYGYNNSALEARGLLYIDSFQ